MEWQPTRKPTCKAPPPVRRRRRRRRRQPAAAATRHSRPTLPTRSLPSRAAEDDDDEDRPILFGAGRMPDDMLAGMDAQELDRFAPLARHKRLRRREVKEAGQQRQQQRRQQRKVGSTTLLGDVCVGVRRGRVIGLGSWVWCTAACSHAPSRLASPLQGGGGSSDDEEEE